MTGTCNLRAMSSGSSPNWWRRWCWQSGRIDEENAFGLPSVAARKDVEFYSAIFEQAAQQQHERSFS